MLEEDKRLFESICTDKRKVNPRTLERSVNLILDPLWHHPDHLKRLDDPNLWETAKELAQLDGAFIISDDGVVLSAATDCI